MSAFDQSTNVIALPPGGGFQPGPLPSPGLPTPGPGFPGPGGGGFPGVGDLLDILKGKGAGALAGVLQDAGVGRGLSQLISRVAVREGESALSGIAADVGVGDGASGKQGLPLSRAVTLVENGDLAPDERVRWQIEYSGRARGDGGGKARDNRVGGAVRRACSSLRTGEGDKALGSGVVHHEFETSARCIPALARELGKVSRLWAHCRIINAPSLRSLPDDPGPDPNPDDPNPPPDDDNGDDGGNGGGFLGGMEQSTVILLAVLLFVATR